MLLCAGHEKDLMIEQIWKRCIDELVKEWGFEQLYYFYMFYVYMFKYLYTIPVLQL